MGPLLRTMSEGIDTLVWLAATTEGGHRSGALFLDRRPRPLDRIPPTRVSAGDRRRLWDVVVALSGAPDPLPEYRTWENRMTRLNQQIRTSLGRDAAFAYIADFANSMHWDPGVATSIRIDDGPVGVGSRFRLGVRVRGRVAPMDYRIAAFEPSVRVVLVGEGPGSRRSTRSASCRTGWAP